MSSPAPFQIAGIDFEPASGDYSGPGIAGRLQPKVLMVLLALVDRKGEVVGKDELFRSVWHQTHVGENVLAQAISDLRRILGSDAIDTVTKVGYRLSASVANGRGSEPAAGAEASPTAPTAGAARFKFWQIVVLLLAGGWVLRMLILAAQGKGHH